MYHLTGQASPATLPSSFWQTHIPSWAAHPSHLHGLHVMHTIPGGRSLASTQSVKMGRAENNSPRGLSASRKQQCTEGFPRGRRPNHNRRSPQQHLRAIRASRPRHANSEKHHALKSMPQNCTPGLRYVAEHKESVERMERMECPHLPGGASSATGSAGCVCLGAKTKDIVIKEAAK